MELLILIVVIVPICIGMALFFDWLIWLAYCAALVPLGAPDITYWQAVLILFVISAIGRCFGTKVSKS